MFTLRYFFGYELPKTLGLAKRLVADDRLTVEMQTEYFNDWKKLGHGSARN